MPSEKEMINNLIDNYTNLQRIKKSDDTEKELNYQLKRLKAKLESFGIITTDLDLQKYFREGKITIPSRYNALYGSYISFFISSA